MLNNPEYIFFKGRKVKLDYLLNDYKRLLQDKKIGLNDVERFGIQKALEGEELKPYQAELIRLQEYLERENRRMIILFEGRDAAGKGGSIRRITRYMNEKHYRVVALGKPTEEQKSQWYYQKYVNHFPRGGEVVLFDRSWYNRAMVERVFGFCTEKEYENFMNGVISFETDIIRHGTILIKLYFSVDKEEQARRFDRRRNDPLRKWKFSEIDLQAQSRWDDFTHVKWEMLKRTHTKETPWIIIRSHFKHKARINTMKIMLSSLPYEKLDPEINLTLDPEIVIMGDKELELMEEDRRLRGSPRY
ncbi:UDP-galactose-lipid carrier transferase [Desulfamplus magnetovallimortis]|uniref:ADP/GDP-polyphosphate phosphotransferase n=1 Tax=Desulfamplus magnetovallimortis TaxID=1246637 RepID=A0A1W1HJP1_9BACT|nr:polyphosphate kinase 2 [Desulfamplus magnetovallimortis]SLM32656.1 UDP-galactose-lipid carrier transferase [Desulfamplus magnetovallimortis]